MQRRPELLLVWRLLRLSPVNVRGIVGSFATLAPKAAGWGRGRDLGQGLPNRTSSKQFRGGIQNVSVEHLTCGKGPRSRWLT